MEAPDDRSRSSKGDQTYRRLPPEVKLEDTIATVDADPVPDPDAGRSLEQHRALRDD
jgi:hypothetical protein